MGVKGWVKGDLTIDKERYISRSADEQNSSNFLDRDDILGISYFVRRAGFSAYKLNLTPGQGSEICTLENRMYVHSNLYLIYCLYIATLLSYASLLVYIYPSLVKVVKGDHAYQD